MSFRQWSRSLFIIGKMSKFDFSKNFYSLAVVASALAVILLPQVVGKKKERVGTFILFVRSYESPYFWQYNDRKYCEGVLYLDVCEVYFKMTVRASGRRIDGQSYTKDTNPTDVARFGNEPILRRHGGNGIEFPIYAGDWKLTFDISIWDEEYFDPNHDLLEKYSRKVYHLQPSNTFTRDVYERKRQWLAYKSWSRSIVNYRLRCEPGYFSTWCFQKCRIPTDQSPYICDRDGIIECKPGLINWPFCNEYLGQPSQYSGTFKLYLVEYVNDLQVLMRERGDPSNFIDYCSVHWTPCKFRVHIRLSFGETSKNLRTDIFLMKRGEKFNFTNKLLTEVGWIRDPYQVFIPFSNVTEFSYSIWLGVTTNKGVSKLDSFTDIPSGKNPNQNYDVERTRRDGDKLISRLRFRYKIICAKYHYGELCQVFCKRPADDSYSCGINGKRIPTRKLGTKTHKRSQRS